MYRNDGTARFRYWNKINENIKENWKHIENLSPELNMFYRAKT